VCQVLFYGLVRSILQNCNLIQCLNWICLANTNLYLAWTKQNITNIRLPCGLHFDACTIPLLSWSYILVKGLIKLGGFSRSKESIGLLVILRRDNNRIEAFLLDCWDSAPLFLPQDLSKALLRTFSHSRSPERTAVFTRTTRNVKNIIPKLYGSKKRLKN